MSWKAIHGALSARLKAFADAEILRVAWENRDFTPPETIYLREALLPASTRAAGLGSNAAQYSPGLYQVDVLAPVGKGHAPASRVVDGLVAHFSRGLILSTSGGIEVVIVKTYPGPAIQEDARLKVPVTVDFYSYVPV